jgi:hypothetical protein
VLAGLEKRQKHMAQDLERHIPVVLWERVKLYLLYQRKQQSQDLETDFVVAEVYAPVIPPPKSSLFVILYQDVGEEKAGEFRVVSEARYYLVNIKKAFPHLIPPAGGNGEYEVSLYVEPIDEAARQWVEGVVRQTVTEGEALMDSIDEMSEESEN